MNPTEVKAFIELLPLIVVYLVPGFVFLWVKSFLLSQRIEEDNHIAVKSIVLSFILINALSIFNAVNINSPGWVILIIFISAILAFVFTKLILWDKFHRILKKCGVNRSFFKSIWNDLADMNHGVWLRLYLPEDRVVYTGTLRKYEEEQENYYLTISNYSSYSYDEKEIDNYYEDSTKWAALNTKDISRIEIFYHPESRRV